MTTSIVYLAGPITNLTQAAARAWREDVRVLATPYGISCLSPVRSKDLEDDVTTYGPRCAPKSGTPHDLFSDQVITTRDFFDLRRSDAMVLHLPDPDRHPVGSLIEFGFANALHIPVILWSPPCPVSQHPMVRHGKYRQTHSLHQTVTALVDLLGCTG